MALSKLSQNDLNFHITIALNFCMTNFGNLGMSLGWLIGGKLVTVVTVSVVMVSVVVGVEFTLSDLLGQLESVEMETGNGNSQNLMQMNARVEPLINDHLLKTTSVQRPPMYKTTSVQRPHKLCPND